MMLIMNQAANAIYIFGENAEIYIDPSMAAFSAVCGVSYVVKMVTSSDEFDLGVYSTEKKARMVLNEITEKYIGCYRAFDMPADEEA